MPQEVLLYGAIYERTAVDFINAINEVEDSGEDLVVRVNTVGGDVLQGWGMAAKFKEYPGSKTVKVDGSAYSMGFMFAAYADEVEALDVSQFMVHRASYGKYYEENYMSDSERENLENVNQEFLKAIKNRIDVKAFEDLKGVKLKDLFSMDDRIDVFLTAKEAKKIGLVNKITKLTPERTKAINSEMGRIAAMYNPDITPATDAGIDKNAKPKEAAASLIVKQKPKKMTKDELKANHPELYAEVFNAGTAQERDRVGAWLKFNDVDAAAVTKGIESGEPISQTAMADFSKKMFSKDALNTVAGEESEKPNPETDAPDASGADEPTAVEAFEKRIASQLETNRNAE